MDAETRDELWGWFAILVFLLVIGVMAFAAAKAWTLFLLWALPT